MYDGYVESQAKVNERTQRIMNGTFGRGGGGLLVYRSFLKYAQQNAPAKPMSEAKNLENDHDATTH